MNYKIKEKDNEIYFKYMPKKINKRIINKKSSKENTFGILKNINFS